MFFYYDYNNCTSCKFKKISTPVNLACPRFISFLRILYFTLYNLLEVGGKGDFLQNGLTSPPLGPVTLYGLKGGGRGEAGEFWLSHNEIYLSSFYAQLRNDKCVSVD